MLKAIVSFAMFLFCLKFRRPYFALLLPFLPLGGYLYVKDLPFEYSFLISYVQVVLLTLFMLEETLADATSQFLCLYPLLSLPSLPLADMYLGNSIVLTLSFVMSAWLYRYFLRNMQWMLERNFFEWIVLGWIFIGVVYRVYYGINFGLMEGVLVRSGGWLGSNYIAGMLIVALPFVRWPATIVLSHGYIFLSYSRGVYAMLILYWLFVLIRFRKKDLMKIGASLLVVGMLIGMFAPASLMTKTLDLTSGRLFGTGYGENTGIRLNNFWDIDHLKSNLEQERRFEIFMNAFKVWEETGYIGTSLGNYRTVLSRIGDYSGYSNPHNMYLTLLVEGGLPFMLAFLGIFGYGLCLSYKYSIEAFFSLLITGIFGCYSGQLYDSHTSSLVPYFLFIFILAYVKYKEQQYNTLDK